MLNDAYKVSVVGIDPGLVDTGVVQYLINSATKQIDLAPLVITRQPAIEIARQVLTLSPMKNPNRFVFVEAYRPRQHFNTDARMMGLVKDVAYECGGRAIPNTGVKKVVKPALLGIMQSQKFALTTNHDDLVSAARIALLGMMKNPDLNELLSDIVRDYIDGSEWDVRIV